MRRYIIIKDHKLRSLASNQTKALNVLAEIQDDEIDDIIDFYLFILYRGRERFVPLSPARLSKLFQEKPRVPIYTRNEIPDDPDRMYENMKEQDFTRIDQLMYTEDECICARYALQEIHLNALVDENGNQIGEL